MSDYLSTYKAELIERHIKNQISNAEKDTLYALLLQLNRSTLTVIERDVFAKLTLASLHTPNARENASKARENVNVASLPLEGIRTLEASEQAQKSVKNKPLATAGALTNGSHSKVPP